MRLTLLRKFFLVALAAIGLFSPAPASALTVADLQGGATLTVGDLVFSNFAVSYGVANSGSTIDFSAITVSASSTADGVGLSLGAYFAPNGTSQSFQGSLTYTVSTINSGLAITGFTSSAMPGLWDNSTGLVGSYSLSGQTTLYANSTSLLNGDLWLTGTFGGVSTLTCLLQVDITTSSDYNGATGDAYMDPVQSFAVEAVPEPASGILALLGVGASLVGYRLRRR